MLGNLMPPVVPVAPAASTAVEVIIRPDRPAGWFLVVHPRYRAWLTRCGIVSAADALDLPGEVVSGHPDRHVCRVELAAGGRPRAVYLKREHRIGLRVRWKNRSAGFGWVSRSEREAKTLQRLEDAGLPGPAWMAYGEDGRGRAFVLVDELTGSAELRERLAEMESRLGAAGLTPLPALRERGRGEGLGTFTQSGNRKPGAEAPSPPTPLPQSRERGEMHESPEPERRALAARVGSTIAAYHRAGFTTPDLSAKHVFVRPGSAGVTVIDWPSAVQTDAVPDAERVRSLAALSASLSEELASPRDRLRAARAYHRAGGLALEFKSFARLIQKEAAALEARPSLREQRRPAKPQPLVWLAGEAVVVTPELADEWPEPADGAPFYPKFLEPAAVGRPVPLSLPDGRACSLLRYRGRELGGRFLSAVRGQVWRSPAARLARTLFHLERCGIDAPRLLAFGQRIGNRGAESFLLHDLPPDAPTLPVWLSSPNVTPAARRAALRRLGAGLRGMHEAGYTLGNGAGSFRVHGGKAVADPAQLTRVRQLADGRRRADLRAVTAGLGRTDAARLAAGYRGTDDRFAGLLRKVVAR